jgi:F-type H+-transporting ATPase subunit gamma
MAHEVEGRDYSLVLIGKKAESYFRFRNYRIDASFTGISDTPKYEDARAVAQQVVSLFESGDVDIVQLVYTEYLSAGSQRVAVRRFLPLESAEKIAVEGHGDSHATASVEFEPSAESVLEPCCAVRRGRLFRRPPRVRSVRARQPAAGDEVRHRQRGGCASQLTRQMNRARQDSITTEIMEIVGGAEAMRSGAKEEAVEAVVWEHQL